MLIAARILIGLFALVTAGSAAAWMLVPEVMGTTTGSSFSTIAALSNARGDMGGLFLALCVFSVLGIGKGPNAPGWLAALAITTAAVALGRLLSIWLDGFDVAILMPLGIELLVVVVALTLRRTLMRS